MRISRQLALALIYSAATLLLAGCTSTAVPQQPNSALPTKSPSIEPTVQPQLTMEAARAIAEKSECAQVGSLGQESTYNPYSKTWWFGLKAEKPGCNPACVVDETTQTATINWRCTGALPPNQPTLPEEQ